MATVLIGLGGTGCNVLRIFADKIKSSTSLYNEQSDKPSIALWSIDADKVEYTPGFDNYWIRTELSVNHAENVQNEEYKKSAFFREWFDPKWRTYGHINGKESPGAGQIKLNGRFAFYHNIEKINTELQKLQSMSHLADGDRYYIISSLFGGTGSGMFFDLVYLLQSRGVPASEIRSFILDPSVLEVVDPRKTNTYSWIAAYPSFVELDFWQSNNEKRNKSLQYNMHYNESNIVQSSKYLSKPMFLFGGKDQNGRSLKSTDNKRLFKNYQEMIANILFEMSFTSEFKQYTGKNTIDNIQESPENDHSLMFASIGLTYLLFPKMKISRFLSYKYLNDSFIPVFTNREMTEDQKHEYAIGFLSEQKLLQNEQNQIISQLDENEVILNWKNNLSGFKERLQRANKKENLQQKPIDILNEKVEKTIVSFIKEKSERIPTPKGLSFQLSENKEFHSYSDLLGKIFIPDMIHKGFLLNDILDILKMITEIYSKELRKASENYQLSEELLASQDYLGKYRKAYSVLRSSKNGLFKKGFNDAKNTFTKIFNNYIKLTEDRYKLHLLSTLYSQLLRQTNEWREILDYVNKRILNASYIKTPDQDRTLRNSPFVFDKEKGNNQLVYELFFGDNYRFIDSKIVKNLMREVEDKSTYSLFLFGTKETPGIIDLLNEGRQTISEEGLKGLNDEIVINKFENIIQKQIEKFVLSKIFNGVSSIEFQDVIKWQFNDIFNYMKNLSENYKSNPEEYNIAKGQFMAMFGYKSHELIESIKKSKSEKDSNKWVNEAVVLFIENIAKEVEPLWQPKAGKKPKYENQIKVHYPKSFRLKIKSPGNDIFEEQATDAYTDKIAILKFSHTMPLSDLDFIGDDLRLMYDNHKKEKLSPDGEKINPIHSDYRFYNLFSWDLFLSRSEMKTSLFTVEYAFGFVLNYNKERIIERKKTGYFYKPSEKFPSKAKIKLGTSYHKGFMKLLKEKKITEDLLYQIDECMKKQIYSFSSDSEKSGYVKSVIKEALTHINEIKPPKIEGSDAYEIWEMTHNNLEQIFNQINESNYLKLISTQ